MVGRAVRCRLPLNNEHSSEVALSQAVNAAAGNNNTVMFQDADIRVTTESNMAREPVPAQVGLPA